MSVCVANPYWVQGPLPQLRHTFPDVQATIMRLHNQIRQKCLRINGNTRALHAASLAVMQEKSCIDYTSRWWGENPTGLCLIQCGGMKLRCWWEQLRDLEWKSDDTRTGESTWVMTWKFFRAGRAGSCRSLFSRSFIMGLSFDPFSNMKGSYWWHLSTDLSVYSSVSMTQILLIQLF